MLLFRFPVFFGQRSGYPLSGPSRSGLKSLHFVLLLLFFQAIRLAGQGTFDLMEEDGKKLLRVSFPEENLKDDFNESSPPLQVYVGKEIPEDHRPPIMGEYFQSGGQIIFNPIFPFREGQPYMAIFQGRDTFIFEIPVSRGRAFPEVIGIFPSSDTLPSNQLKIYLHFSTPMSEGHAYEFVGLIDEAGDTLDRPFVELQPELWDKEHRRLTLWLDPGRVKRDLGPNQLLGPPLEEGISYTLFVDPKWENAAGLPLKEEVEKYFYAHAADRRKPEAGRWKVNPPFPGARMELTVEFGESLDRELALQYITVLDPSGLPVEGEVRLGRHEKYWSFTPERPWLPGNYRIQIASKIEDLAGNNLNRLFDRDLEDISQAASVEAEFYWLEFEVKDD